MMPFALSALIGLTLWGVAAFVSHPRELWDVALFWSRWYPAALLASALLGAAFPAGAWRWPAILFAMLVPVLVAQGLATGSGFGMLGPGLVLTLLMALPGAGTAVIAARLRGR